MTKLKQLKDQFPAATAEKKPKGENMTFTTVLPRSVIKQLRVNAAEAETTIRVEILKGLVKAGYQVNESELVDKRK